MKKILFRQLSESVQIPQIMTVGATGFDLFAPHDFEVPAYGTVWIPSKIAVTLPEGTVGRIESRLTLARKGLISISGNIYPNYQGELDLGLYNTSNKAFEVRKGDRIAVLTVTGAVTAFSLSQAIPAPEYLQKGSTGLRTPSSHIPTAMRGKILCVSAKAVHEFLESNSKTKTKGFNSWVVPVVLSNMPLISIPRYIAETNTDYLQLLPYVVVQKKSGEILMYRRGKAGQEAKLHDKYSIGLGGHVDESLDYFEETYSNESVWKILNRNIARELKEEIGKSAFNLLPKTCLVTQDLDNPKEVGWYHIGILYVFTVPNDFEPVTEDQGMKEFVWKTLEELSQINLETWSQSVLDYLNKEQS